jgi:hypothetical protein
MGGVDVKSRVSICVAFLTNECNYLDLLARLTIQSRLLRLDFAREENLID